MSCAHSTSGTSCAECLAYASQEKQYSDIQMDPLVSGFAYPMQQSYSHDSAFYEQPFAEYGGIEPQYPQAYSNGPYYPQSDYSSPVGPDMAMGVDLAMDMNVNASMVNIDVSGYIPSANKLPVHPSQEIEPVFGNDGGMGAASYPLDISVPPSSNNALCAVAAPESNFSYTIPPGSSLPFIFFDAEMNSFTAINVPEPAPVLPKQEFAEDKPVPAALTSIPAAAEGSSPEHLPEPAAPKSKAAKAKAAKSDQPKPPKKEPIRPFACPLCGKHFTRQADVKRHESSVHNPVPMDCPVANCIRKGRLGFSRRDHLLEHQRSFHGLPIPKRTVQKRKFDDVAPSSGQEEQGEQKQAKQAESLILPIPPESIDRHDLVP